MDQIIVYSQASKEVTKNLPTRKRTKKIIKIVRKKEILLEMYYAHTNRFCVVQENIKPEVLEVQAELARSVH